MEPRQTLTFNFIFLQVYTINMLSFIIDEPVDYDFSTLEPLEELQAIAPSIIKDSELQFNLVKQLIIYAEEEYKEYNPAEDHFESIEELESGQFNSVYEVTIGGQKQALRIGSLLQSVLGKLRTTASKLRQEAKLLMLNIKSREFLNQIRDVMLKFDVGMTLQSELEPIRTFIPRNLLTIHKAETFRYPGTIEMLRNQLTTREDPDSPEYSIVNYQLTEFVEGSTLRDFMKIKPMLRYGFSIFLQMWWVYLILNNSGFYHNDVKSNNIMIRNHGVYENTYDGFGACLKVTGHWFCPVLIDYDLRVRLEQPEGEQRLNLVEADSAAQMMINLV